MIKNFVCKEINDILSKIKLIFIYSLSIILFFFRYILSEVIILYIDNINENILIYIILYKNYFRFRYFYLKNNLKRKYW